MTPVDPLVVAVLVVLAALVGIVAGFIGARVQDRFRLTKSQTDAKDIVARLELGNVLPHGFHRAGVIYSETSVLRLA